MHSLSEHESVNPVLTSAKYIIKNNPNVVISSAGVNAAAKQLLDMMDTRHYSPATWREQPLHLVPPSPFDPLDPRTKQCLDWIFLVSALNFSFWSELEGSPKRYGVTLRRSWDDTSGAELKWEGYWSLLAALNKALGRGVPITDPLFYADELACPDSLIEEIFKAADGCAEPMPLLPERIAIMRQVGRTFMEKIPGQCFMSLLTSSLISRSEYQGHTLALLDTIVELFPCFRDESTYEGNRVVFWKRAQILIAETWAAFYPLETSRSHPLLPDGVDGLTMFADYRVPQILQNLGILSYSPELTRKLVSRQMLPYGSSLESSIRAGGIIAVEELKREMEQQASKQKSCESGTTRYRFNSVLIDFFLWDLAKLVESGKQSIESPVEALPCHRTRSIFY